MKNFVRVNYILHLLLFLTFLGAIVWISITKKGYWSAENKIHFLLFTVYFLFLIKYSVDYRDFSNQKLIFLFPVLYSIVHIFSTTLNQIKTMALLNFILFACSTLYIVNFVYLAIALS